jgi:sulfur relay (sulfurtransferase) DsrF/TusC family protein
MAVAHRTVTHVFFVDGGVVERGFHSDAITTPNYFDTVYSVFLIEIFIHYTTVCKEAQHINTQVFNHN